MREDQNGRPPASRAWVRSRSTARSRSAPRRSPLRSEVCKRKVELGHLPVFVAAQIKDDPIVAYEVYGATKLPLYLGGICPTRFRYNGHPGTDRTLSMRVTRPKFPQRPAGDHLHLEIIPCHHSGDSRI